MSPASKLNPPKATFPNLFGYKAYPAPLWKPYRFLLLGAGVSLYLVSQLQDVLVRLPENVDNPENPYRKQILAERAAAAGHH